VQQHNINVSVGNPLPPSVSFAPVPPALVRIEPAWRGLAYFLFGEEIVLVNPRTRRIVAVVRV
jgi:hypothetical protein